jgi:hypothetical protein
MRRDEKNLYRVDDVLLRAGGIGLLLVLVVGVCAVLVALGEADPDARGAIPSWVGDYGVAYFGALLCPLVALRIGFVIRRREERSAAIWRLLRRNAELSVANLVGNSDFDLADVERTVKLLNNRGLGHYVWDRRTGTIQDGRLRTIQLHVDKCEACGGSVSLEVPIGFSEAPACPYCGDPVCVDALETRRHEALDELRVDEREPSWREGSKVPFSIPLFAVLMLTFWPAGLLYAWYKCQQAA